MRAPNKVCRTFAFTPEGNTAMFQTGHWSETEEQHTWALSPQCGLLIPITESASNLALLIDVEPALGHPCIHKRSVSIFVDTRSVLQIQIKKRGIFLVPIGAAAANSVVAVDFRFNDSACQIGSDTRPLALMFRMAIMIDRPSSSKADVSIEPAFLKTTSETQAIKLVETAFETSISDFITRFESLGQSCDFGLFQRKCGADPLGLLRFAAITTHKLIHGLLDKFDNLGSSGTLQASVNSDWHNEYMIYDTVYGLSLHTFLGPHQASPEQVLARENLHLKFLRRMFLEVLDSGEKTFVLRRPEHVARPEAEAITEVLRLFSPATLLWAVQDGDKPPGTVDAHSEYLFQGYLDVCDTGSASIQAWLSLCYNSEILKVVTKRDKTVSPLAQGR